MTHIENFGGIKYIYATTKYICAFPHLCWPFLHLHTFLLLSISPQHFIGGLLFFTVIVYDDDTLICQLFIQKTKRTNKAYVISNKEFYSLCIFVVPEKYDDQNVDKSKFTYTKCAQNKQLCCILSSANDSCGSILHRRHMYCHTCPVTKFGIIPWRGWWTQIQVNVTKIYNTAKADAEGSSIGNSNEHQVARASRMWQKSYFTYTSSNKSSSFAF